MTRDSAGASTIPLLTFDLGEHRLALRAESVHEVVRVVWIAPLPDAPPNVEGVVNVRGVLMPVLDVRARFGLPFQPVDLHQHLIIADAGPRRVAMRVDRAVELVSADQGAIERARRVVAGGGDLAGIARLADGLLVIVDLARFLSLDESLRIDVALRATGVAPVAPSGQEMRS